MRIIVLGAGAIGSLYGAKLSRFNDVTLVARQQHVDNIRKYGLKITGIEERTYNLKALAEIKKIEDKTLILLTTKVYDSRNAIGNIKNLIKNDTIILCLQNGLYTEDIVKKIIENKCLVLRGITNFGAVFLNPGVIQYNNYSYTAIEKSAVSIELAQNFKKCGLNGYVSENIKEDMWKKLIFNCAVNPVTAILKIENGALSSEALNPLKKLIMDECLAVAKSDGVNFDIDFVKTINEGIRGSKNISSMQQDLLKGNHTEIDYLNGAVVKLGKKYGIKCQVNESLVSIIKFLESQ